MEQAQLTWLTNLIWNIADDVLRDVYVRGKYRDVILPMTVLRRLDAVLEPTKQTVLDMKASLDKELITNYRSLTTAHKVSVSNTTILVGRNNEGKSNLLKALDVAMNVLRHHAIFLPGLIRGDKKYS